MATETLAIPVSQLSAPSSWTSDSGLKAYPDAIKKTWEKYKSLFNQYAKTSRIPPAVLLAFSYIESGGKSDVVSPTGVNVGLFQWNYNYGHSYIEQEYAAGRLSDAEMEYLTLIGKRMGFTFNNGKMSRSFTKKDAMDPSLNIFVGSIILGQLMDSMVGSKKDPIKWATENGKARLDRVIVVYNAGAYGVYGKRARNAEHATPQEAIASLPAETGNYIKKLLGKNGALDIIQRDLPEVSMTTI